MKQHTFIFITFIIGITTVFSSSFAQTPAAVHENPIVLQTASGSIEGTLMLPEKSTPIPVVLIIAGSGPTDRNGNNPTMHNGSLRMLADSLANNGIASVRYDKRGVGASAGALKAEKDIRFNDYVNDAIGWLQLLQKDKRFNKIVVIGHSEGSLIGMLAAKHNANAFVSIAGAGMPAADILKTQLATQPEPFKQMIYADIDTLQRGDTLRYVNPLLYSLFRPSVQPYLISWFQYNPAKAIAALKDMPVCIIQGTADIQISEADAKLLAQADPAAQLVMIPEMNHIFKNVNGDRNANIATYNNPSLPINAQLVKTITAFIHALP